ncbi:hypothetical protein [Streptomyces sp. NPDC059874]|uniref:hypothetical protein n=1 Tax=Streptomyces sp. NPDC059874 TaxID=3346983 RepID=UPI00364CE12E
MPLTSRPVADVPGRAERADRTGAPAARPAPPAPAAPAAHRFLPAPLGAGPSGPGSARAALRGAPGARAAFPGAPGGGPSRAGSARIATRHAGHAAPAPVVPYFGAALGRTHASVGRHSGAPAVADSTLPARATAGPVRASLRAGTGHAGRAVVSGTASAEAQRPTSPEGHRTTGEGA